MQGALPRNVPWRRVVLRDLSRLYQGLSSGLASRDEIANRSQQHGMARSAKAWDWEIFPERQC